MRSTAKTILAHGRRRGLSIFEVMISLAIVAMLLSAVATAFSASSAVIEANDEFFRASQAARVTMNQLLAEVRRSDNIDVFTDRLNVGQPEKADGTPGNDVRFRYDSATKRLLFCPDVNAVPLKEYTLSSNVTACKFTADMKAGATPTYPVRVAIELDVVVGNNQVRLTGSAAPRRAQDWN